MRMHESGCVALLAIALSAGAVVTAPVPAHADNFFQRLFNPSDRHRQYRPSYNRRGPSRSPYAQRREPAYRDQGYGRDRGYNDQNRQDYHQPVRQRPEHSAPAPKHVAKVTGPKYYTYKPDKLVVASLADLADSVVTGSVPQNSLPSLSDNPFDEAQHYLSDIKIRAMPKVISAIKAHYSADPHFIWVSGTAVNGRARSVLAVLDNASAVGLDPRDYKVDVPADAFDISDMAIRQKALMTFEMKLSAAVLTYALDATRGRVAPDRISGYHDLPRKKIDLAAALSSMQKTGDAGAWLSGRNPQGSQFSELKAKLASLRAAGPAGRVTIADGTLIKPGQSSPQVSNVVKAIEANGSDDLKERFADVLSSYDGGSAYSHDIVAMVKAFQKENGLGVDGVVGPNTIAALTGFSNADKIDKVVFAMERARWLPGSLPPHRVFVNEAAFEAAYFDNNDLKLKTRVVVGKKAHQTNFFSDQIETVEFNPYWGVPQSIIINEMLPKLRRNASYLDRMGYQLQYKGRDVSSASFNWNTIGSTKAFSVRQPPGSDNALGQLKILFPNKHAIYLHDTPSKSLFKRTVRDYSHGCVRMQDPRGMAAEVLGISRQKVADYIKTGRNQGVEVPHKIPVFLAYFTAWPNAKGTVKFYRDVYDRDMYLDRAIASTETERHAEG